MKHASLPLLLFCAPLFSQGLPENAAARSLENRLKTLKLMLPALVRLKAQTPVCSVPLLAFVPKGNFAMPVVKPSAQTAAGGTVQVPAPACDSNLFPGQ